MNLNLIRKIRLSDLKITKVQINGTNQATNKQTYEVSDETNLEKKNRK